jgi:hypothetical protein
MTEIPLRRQICLGISIRKQPGPDKRSDTITYIIIIIIS